MLLTGLNLRSALRPGGSAGSERQSRAAFVAIALAAAAFSSMPAAASAQIAPTGRTGAWVGLQPGFVPVVQPVRVDLGEQEGQVAFYSGPDGAATILPAPAVAGLCVHSVYRIKLSDMRDFPGLELYPTIEVIDRLHPPRGREVEFAIPVTLTAEEIAAAIAGRLVTKVIYLEQPHREATVPGTTAGRVRRVLPHENALAVANEAGRPMVIVRLGGRTPDAGASEPGFFGTCAPVQFYGPPPPAPAMEAARR
jgi:hypothetical protein